MVVVNRSVNVKKQIKDNTTKINDCKRKTNIVFIKTHKTASTAVQVSRRLFNAICSHLLERVYFKKFFVIFVEYSSEIWAS